jgi:hypothetical protein
MKFHDVIDSNFKQKSVMLISDEGKLEIVADPKYLPILESLREGYKTVKEIEKDYTKFIEKEVRKHYSKDEKIIQELVEKRKRSDQSLYRYVQDLVKAGFVTCIGKRIDKPMIEKLFARTAKLFLNDKYYEKLISSSKTSIESLARLIELIYEIPKPDDELIGDYCSQMEASFQKITKKLFKEKPEEYVKIVEKLSLQEINSVIQIISILDLVVNQAKYKKLLAVFD